MTNLGIFYPKSDMIVIDTAADLFGRTNLC